MLDAMHPSGAPVAQNVSKSHHQSSCSSDCSDLLFDTTSSVALDESDATSSYSASGDSQGSPPEDSSSFISAGDLFTDAQTDIPTRPLQTPSSQSQSSYPPSTVPCKRKFRAQQALQHNMADVGPLKSAAESSIATKNHNHDDDSDSPAAMCKELLRAVIAKGTTPTVVLLYSHSPDNKHVVVTPLRIYRMKKQHPKQHGAATSAPSCSVAGVGGLGGTILASLRMTTQRASTILADLQKNLDSPLFWDHIELFMQKPSRPNKTPASGHHGSARMTRQQSKILAKKSGQKPEQPKPSRSELERPTYLPAYYSRPSKKRFLTKRMPQEVLENIVPFVSSADVKNLRLVDRHVSKMVSASLFRTLVLPFTTGFYGSLGTEATFVAARGKLPMNDNCANIDLDIFPGFGQYIHKFGLTFDIDLTTLADPPTKKGCERYVGYWGTYDWPHRSYMRFKKQADLENVADETQTMKRAFAEIKNATELGISLDCGLGWLNGSDLSIRATVLSTTAHNGPFPSRFDTSPEVVAKRKLWTALEQAFSLIRRSETLRRSELVRHIAEPNFHLRNLGKGARSFIMGRDFITKLDNDGVNACEPPDDSLSQYFNRYQDAQAGEGPVDYDAFEYHANLRKPKCTNAGLLYTRLVVDGVESHPTMIKPNMLSPPQKEWILETAWAQDAFLTSYVIAIADNRSIFSKIKKLTLSRLSSRHLPKLGKELWSSLPLLESLDIKIIADHRIVDKDRAGDAVLQPTKPSKAVNIVCSFLNDHIGPKSSVKTLSVGWADGGEHAEGVFARNKLLLPAPIMRLVAAPRGRVGLDSTPLVLPHIHNLEIVNCWITPHVLETFVLAARQRSLRKLTLTSVSMTTDTRYLSTGHAPAAPVNAAIAPAAGLPAAAVVFAPAAVPMVPANPAPGTINATVPGPTLAQIQAQQEAARSYRSGGWQDVLERLKIKLTERNQSEFEVVFLSCGYAMLPLADFNQSDLEEYANSQHSLSEDRTKYAEIVTNKLQEQMIPANDVHFGTIVTTLGKEMRGLEQDWGLERGWPSKELAGMDYDDDYGWGKWGEKTKLAAEFDGTYRGGTGRFSGRTTNFWALHEESDDDDSEVEMLEGL